MTDRRGRASFDHCVPADELGRQFGQRWPGSKHIDADSGATQILRPASRKVVHGRLGRTVAGIPITRMADPVRMIESPVPMGFRPFYT